MGFTDRLMLFLRALKDPVAPAPVNSGLDARLDAVDRRLAGHDKYIQDQYRAASAAMRRK